MMPCHVNTSCITGSFDSYHVVCLFEQAVEYTVELSVIWVTMTFMYEYLCKIRNILKKMPKIINIIICQYDYSYAKPMPLYPFSI